jgi:hypothetical protein
LDGDALGVGVGEESHDEITPAAAISKNDNKSLGEIDFNWVLITLSPSGKKHADLANLNRDKAACMPNEKWVFVQ